jgi:hypothetical protein
MSRTFHNGERRIRVCAVRRERPDLAKLGRALIDLARAQAEAEAEQTHRSKLPPDHGLKRAHRHGKVARGTE